MGSLPVGWYNTLPVVISPLQGIPLEMVGMGEVEFRKLRP
jgi:hypothetical protein